ncbi:TonB-dependent receptor [Chitinimonas viridis]|uniref:TonB-dependent receptor n=1 Tax=Chitinimonas viridis TaxID=664880 RepID=A0ABT8B352_9NEIS|nr:TonB-dependent receptor [Chitinimonas viridis]MDN3576125.1 TonB-dependent receptor [Chitinimonas viridis]
MKSHLTPCRTVMAICIASLMQGTHAADEAPVTTITVTGQAARIRNALDVQQADDSIVSVVHADAIGALPDTNAAEALQRVPGVSVERDQGEGRYIRVRGLGPDLNSVTINGGLIPSPESDRRAVMLDVIPSALIRSLEVKKTLTPDQDANSIGGTVEVKTVSAFDYPGRFSSFEAEASHDQHTGQTSPKIATTFADRYLDGKLGLAAGLSLEKRKFGSANIETGGNWDFDDDKVLLEEFENRNYLITRERLGMAFNLDYKAVAGQRYYARTLLSRYSDTEERQAHVIEFDEAQDAGELGEAESTRELKSRKETQKILSLTLGTEQQLGPWQLKLAGGISRASETTPDHIAGAAFEGSDSFADVGFHNGEQPTLVGPASLYDAQAYGLKEVELAHTQFKDRERHLRLDLARNLQVGQADIRLKFGGKASHREKTGDEDIWLFEDLDDAGQNESQLQLSHYSDGAADWKLGRFGPRIDASKIDSLLGKLDRTAYADEEGSRVNDFSLTERIRAAYLQAQFETGDWRWLAGVRYEGTRLKADGTGLENGSFIASHTARKYHHWLPALHARHDLDRHTSLRMALTHSVVRPTFGQMAPGFVIDGDEASFGNPDLKPLESRNLDLGLEQRLVTAGTLSAYVFHKRMDNFIYGTDLAGTGRWTDFDEASSFANGGRASVRGVELNYVQSFAQGWLLSANATFSDSIASISRYDADLGRMVARDVPLPSQSDRTANLTLGYESGPVSLRLATNYKSAYLLEVSDVLDARRDLYVASQTQYDFSASYKLGKAMMLSFEALNLGNEPYYAYMGQRRHNAQFETYGRTYKLGLKYTLN